MPTGCFQITMMPAENERTVAQMAAFFLYQSQDKKLSHLKLMKLLYLADREMIKQYGCSMSSDYPVSMPNGPVLSQTLDLMGGGIKSHQDGWTTWISAKANNEVSLKQHRNLCSAKFEECLDRISPAELAILNVVWKQFGQMSRWEICDWTHEHCAEWTNPNGSSKPISFLSLAKSVKFGEEAAKEIAEEIESMQRLNRQLASCA